MGLDSESAFRMELRRKLFIYKNHMVFHIISSGDRKWAETNCTINIELCITKL